MGPFKLVDTHVFMARLRKALSGTEANEKVVG